MESHGERLWATANNGRGGAFHVTLPTQTKLLDVKDPNFQGPSHQTTAPGAELMVNCQHKEALMDMDSAVHRPYDTARSSSVPAHRVTAISMA
jgi:hypothetical protein